MRLFAISAQNAGFETKVIPCRSTKEKPTVLAEVIRGMDDKALLCATDAFDVLCTNTPESVIDAFEASRHDLIFGAERKPYHHFKTSVAAFESAEPVSSYRYLNGGVFVGYAGAVREMLSEMRSQKFGADGGALLLNKRDDFNDQTLFGIYAAAHSDRVALDHDARICWNIADEWDVFFRALTKSSDPFRNPSTGQRPAFVHVSGIAPHYPAYLLAAQKLGIRLSGNTVNFHMLRQHLAKGRQSLSAAVAAPDVETLAALSRTWQFHLSNVVEKTKQSARVMRSRFREQGRASSQYQ
jgi:hypothetical protein